jgi:hypothetical protein
LIAGGLIWLAVALDLALIAQWSTRRNKTYCHSLLSPSLTSWGFFHALRG